MLVHRAGVNLQIISIRRQMPLPQTHRYAAARPRRGRGGLSCWSQKSQASTE
jgi:hypothetical protein